MTDKEHIAKWLKDKLAELCNEIQCEVPELPKDVIKGKILAFKEILFYMKSLQEEPAPKVFEDMLDAKTPAESLGISQEEYDKIVDECIYGKIPEMVDIDDLPFYDCRIQYASIESGIKAHAEDYSWNIESELFQQLTPEQQKLWRKEIEQAVISGGYSGLNLAKDPRYKENLEVKEVDLEKHLKEDIEDVFFDLDGVAVKGVTHYLTVEDVKDIAKHFFELGMAS